MTLKEQLAGFQALRLKAGLSEAEIKSLEEELSTAIPSEYAELLRYAAGFESSGLGNVDFTGRSVHFEFKELVPRGLPLLQTEGGNCWVLDIVPGGEWSRVFFFSHDPPVMALQFQSIKGFVASAANGKALLQEAASLASAIWKDEFAGIDTADARVSPDQSMADFARDLPDAFGVFDLREAPTPKGIAWGRGAPNLQCKRYGFEMIFAVERAVPKRGFLSRLLNRA